MQTNSKISNIQFELLKLYVNNISDVNLFEIEKMLASYFAKKLDTAFDDFYESNKMTPENLQNWESEHNRIINDKHFDIAKESIFPKLNIISSQDFINEKLILKV
jgi:predicted hydrocarbon binding protein